MCVCLLLTCHVCEGRGRKAAKAVNVKCRKRGKCPSALTDNLLGSFPYFLSRQRDSHQSKQVTLHCGWRKMKKKEKVAVIWLFKATALSFLAYADLNVCAFFFFLSFAALTESFECKIRCKSQTLHLQHSFSRGPTRCFKPHSSSHKPLVTLKKKLVGPFQGPSNQS